MNFHDCIYFLGLPSTLSLFSLVMDKKYKNAHYIALGVWIGVLLKFLYEAELEVFIYLPVIFIIYHLLNIIYNEYNEHKERIVRRNIKLFFERF